MPRGDGTGPEGKGARTGRGMGKSAGNKSGQNTGMPRRQNNPPRGQNNGDSQRKGSRGNRKDGDE